MRWTSFLAIYFIIWFLSLFFVLPFGVRTAEEEGKAKVPGQAESAPHEFRGGRIFLRTTILAAVFFLIFYLNFRFEWITVRSFDFLYSPPVNLRDQ